MKSDLKKLTNYSRQLFEKFYKLYKTEDQRTDLFHVGLGSFVDKRVSPASAETDAFRKNPCLTDASYRDQCEPNYVFRNNLPLEHRDADSFVDELTAIQDKFSSNTDFNEAGLDALIQATVCQDQVNWRRDKATRKMIVYMSDAGFHAQGDARVSNLYQRHDEKCHLDMNNVEIEGDEFDYPSMGQTAQIINDASIMVAFTISNNNNSNIDHIISSYDDLSGMITTSKVITVNNDVNNDDAADQIFELFKDLAYRAVLRLPELGDNYDLQVKKTTVRDDHNKVVDSECTHTCKNINPG